MRPFGLLVYTKKVQGTGLFSATVLVEALLKVMNPLSHYSWI